MSERINLTLHSPTQAAREMKFCPSCQCETLRNKAGDCRPCDNARSSAYYAANKAKASAKSAERYQKNKDQTKTKVAARAKIKRAEVLAYQAKWRSENKAQIQAVIAEWKAKNPDALRAHNATRRARKKGAGGTYTAADIQSLLALQKYKCVVCRGCIKEGYHVDHNMPLLLGGTNSRENLQLLCPTCNLQKNAKHPVAFMQSRGFLL
jgi:5-methylcytosine-specific restriction endonuclease McrA